ncbi:MAG TPA: hypothetical protein PKE40_00310 [Arachnia sp.]|nr:hypothetical protein [Arachnia sp.]HMT84767.1 hypothetical protein [Arachnia sp.]
MVSGPAPTDEGWVYAPASEEARASTELGCFTVDNETFVVRRRDDDGSTHYAWISGPNLGYGFSASGGTEPLSPEQHRASIRDFLAGIDPRTGFF